MTYRNEWIYILTQQTEKQREVLHSNWYDVAVEPCKSDVVAHGYDPTSITTQPRL